MLSLVGEATNTHTHSEESNFADFIDCFACTYKTNKGHNLAHLNYVSFTICLVGGFPVLSLQLS